MNLESLMQAAIELALRGRGKVEPNPRVGALALAGDRIVGRGWHDLYGGPHAEIMAMAEADQAGERADTLVVTLEPCSTPQGQEQKKTRACTEALQISGIKRLVFGVEDPDPRHLGRARSELVAAGLEVVSGVLADACAAINRPFQRWLGLDRPWTIAKYAMSLDGKTATGSGDSRWISSEQSRQLSHRYRATVDAVVVGYRTADRDDPELSTRHVPGKQAIRILVDPLARLDNSRRLIAQAKQIPTWILLREDVAVLRRQELQSLGLEVIELGVDGERGLDLSAGWRELRRRGLNRVMVEGGGGLVAALMAAHCLDQVLGFLAPRLIGGRGAPSPLAGKGIADLAAAPHLQEFYWFASGADLGFGAFILGQDGSTVERR